MLQSSLVARHCGWCAILVIVGLIISALIPPFQSPDEYDHVKRAAILGDGHLMLRKADTGAGGDVDNGLLAYFSIYERLKFKGDEKVYQDDLVRASELHWGKGKTFSPAPGTGYYFPAIYLPQASGLLIGRVAGLTIEQSYTLARVLAMICTVAVLAWAFRLFPVNPFAIAVMLLPMSLFQFASASIDGFSTAVAVLAISLFMRGAVATFCFERWMSWVLCACLFVVCTSRLHLLPMLAMPLVVWYTRRRMLDFLLFWGAAAVSLAWVFLAVKASYVARAGAGLSTTEVIGYYATNPGDLVQAYWNTVSNPMYMDFYRRSLIGILGWLDTPLPSGFYFLASLLIVGALICSTTLSGNSVSAIARIVVAGCAIVASFLAFFALLVTWNPVPASIIEGVQGRYFLVPLIMLGYAMAGPHGFSAKPHRVVAIVLLAVLVVADAYVMPRTLVDRYFTTVEGRPPEITDRRPLKPLSRSMSLRLTLIEQQRRAPATVVRLGVLFATYGKQADGVAILRLTDDNGRTVERQIELSQLIDNQYRFFDVEPLRYVSAEVRYLTGGAVTAYESVDARGNAAACLVYEFSNGSRRMTAGCPPP